MAYTTKKDFWGNTVYYDERGNEIGKKEKSWLGDWGVYKNGHKVADLETDYNENENIVFRSTSLFGSDRTIKPQNAKTDIDFCDRCGEYLYGDEDCDCEE